MSTVTKAQLAMLRRALTNEDEHGCVAPCGPSEYRMVRALVVDGLLEPVASGHPLARPRRFRITSAGRVMAER